MADGQISWAELEKAAKQPKSLWDQFVERFANPTLQFVGQAAEPLALIEAAISPVVDLTSRVGEGQPLGEALQQTGQQYRQLVQELPKFGPFGASPQYLSLGEAATLPSQREFLRASGAMAGIAVLGSFFVPGPNLTALAKAGKAVPLGALSKDRAALELMQSSGEALGLISAKSLHDWEVELGPTLKPELLTAPVKIRPVNEGTITIIAAEEVFGRPEVIVPSGRGITSVKLPFNSISDPSSWATLSINTPLAVQLARKDVAAAFPEQIPKPSVWRDVYAFQELGKGQYAWKSPDDQVLYTLEVLPDGQVQFTEARAGEYSTRAEFFSSIGEASRSIFEPEAAMILSHHQFPHPKPEEMGQLVVPGAPQKPTATPAAPAVFDPWKAGVEVVTDVMGGKLPELKNVQGLEVFTTLHPFTKDKLAEFNWTDPEMGHVQMILFPDQSINLTLAKPSGKVTNHTYLSLEEALDGAPLPAMKQLVKGIQDVAAPAPTIPPPSGGGSGGIMDLSNLDDLAQKLQKLASQGGLGYLWQTDLDLQTKVVKGIGTPKLVLQWDDPDAGQVKLQLYQDETISIEAKNRGGETTIIPTTFVGLDAAYEGIDLPSAQAVLGAVFDVSTGVLDSSGLLQPQAAAATVSMADLATGVVLEFEEHLPQWAKDYGISPQSKRARSFGLEAYIDPDPNSPYAFVASYGGMSGWAGQSTVADVVAMKDGTVWAVTPGQDAVLLGRDIYEAADTLNTAERLGTGNLRWPNPEATMPVIGQYLQEVGELPKWFMDNPGYHLSDVLVMNHRLQQLAKEAWKPGDPLPWNGSDDWTYIGHEPRDPSWDAVLEAQFRRLYELSDGFTNRKTLNELLGALSMHISQLNPTLNRMLREPQKEAEALERFAGWAEALDKLFVPAPHDLRVKRGVYDYFIFDRLGISEMDASAWPKLLIGKVIGDRANVSTSWDPQWMEGVSHHWSGNARLDIEVPKGYPVIDAWGLNLRPFFASETEIVLKRGTPFEIVHFDLDAYPRQWTLRVRPDRLKDAVWLAFPLFGMEALRQYTEQNLREAQYLYGDRDKDKPEL